MLKPQAAPIAHNVQQFPSGSALPGTGFSTHKRRQDKCGTGNSNGRSVAASRERPDAQRQQKPPPRQSGRDMLKPVPVFNPRRPPFFCIAQPNPHSLSRRIFQRSFSPWRWHSVAVCANSHSRRSICLTRNDIRRHPPRQIAVCAVAAADFVDRLASGASAGDYRFAIDHANDVQPAYLTVLTKTPCLPRLNIDGIVISPALKTVSQRAILSFHAIGSGKIVIIGFDCAAKGIFHRRRLIG